MTDALARFLRSSRGAVSTDWIILTATLLGTGAAVMSDLGQGPAPAGWRPDPAAAAPAAPVSARDCAGGIDRLRLPREAGAPLAPLAEREAARLTALECDLRARGVGARPASDG